ncbi:MAG: tetratricopeptide repeat protein [Planctomycetes bacterium]|nr:tetratricopeptide repeat protein [Planctomycetota bacterium]
MAGERDWQETLAKAQKAYREGDFDTAMAGVQDALGQATTDAARAEVLVRQALLVQIKGDKDAAIGLARESEQLAARASRRDLQAEAWGLIGGCYLQTSRLDSALDAFLKAEQAARQSGQLKILVREATLRARVLFETGAIPEAITLLRELKDLAEVENDHDITANVSLHLGHSLAESGDMAAAAHEFQHCIDIADGKDRDHLRASALSALAEVRVAQERFDEAIELCKHAIRSDSFTANPMHRRMLEANLGTALSKAGRTEEAIDTIRRALEPNELTRTEANFFVTSSQALGTVLINVGRPGEAEQVLRDALEVAAKSGQELIRARILTKLAEADLLQGHLDTANRLVMDAHQQLDEFGLARTPDSLNCVTLMARVAWELHKEADARSLAEEAHALADDLVASEVFNGNDLEMSLRPIRHILGND